MVGLLFHSPRTLVDSGVRSSVHSTHPALVRNFLSAIFFVVGSLFADASEKVTSEGDSEFKVQAVKVEDAIVIDGDLNEATWTDLAASQESIAAQWTRIGRPGEPASDKRIAHFAYDEKHLYIAVEIETGMDIPEDAEPATGLDSIRVDFEGAALGIDSDGQQLPEILFPYLIPIQSATRETEKGWTGEIAVEWSQLPVESAPGSKFLFNIAGTDISGQISWAAAQDFRDVKSFGMMELEQ